MTNGTFPSGWYQDPSGQGEARYWNGVAWTDSVIRGGVTVSAPIGVDHANLPPAPGSEYRAAPPAQPAPSPRRTSPWAIVLGIAAIVLLVVVIALLVSDDGGGGDPNPPDTLVTTPDTEVPTSG